MYTEEEFLPFYRPDWGRAMWRNAGVGVKSELKRRAWNDCKYTKEEFMSFCGTSKCLAMWESAGVEEPDLPRLRTEAKRRESLHDAAKAEVNRWIDNWGRCW